MHKLVKPLTDTHVSTAKPFEGKVQILADGLSMYLEITAAGTRIWRMSYRQENEKQNRLTFRTYSAFIN
ncbi:integrase arm-type DNA-binding domain-containing protein [Herminiimonas aquatilis]|uniref:Integrase arm-type DNA-binding domain-containing protein n=1 Tax=Herminiimonas aquatilis TaxID=345342 RepID=A0ABW2J7X4_9BURK